VSPAAGVDSDAPPPAGGVVFPRVAFISAVCGLGFGLLMPMASYLVELQQSATALVDRDMISLSDHGPPYVLGRHAAICALDADAIRPFGAAAKCSSFLFGPSPGTGGALFCPAPLVPGVTAPVARIWPCTP